MSAGNAGLPAFPGALGFGAGASGGRGGAVLAVTTLDPDPAGIRPGSLNHALRQTGPRTVVFRVSGVIHGVARVHHGNLTVAGQTSPGGIVVRGFLCDGHYEGLDCDNLIVRHLRMRPAPQHPLPPGGERLDDALRLDGIRRAIFDHVSLAHAEDEALQISWASDLTVQYAHIAETVGSHAEYGGVLLNYAHPDYPQDRIALLRSLWARLGGRLPEISCEASAYPGQPPQIAACQQAPLQLELSDNLYADPGFLVWYERHVDQNPAAGPYRLHLNAVGNRFVVRAGFPYAMWLSDLLAVPANQLHLSGNTLSRYPGLADYQLFHCCNDFPAHAPNTNLGVAERLDQRHPFPHMSYLAPGVLLTEISGRAGAFPRDPQDRRLAALARQTSFPDLPHGVPVANDAFALDYDPQSPPPAPADSDGDGMPDAFEIAHQALGLSPAIPDHNGTTLSLPLLGIAGYTNLEVYLHLLALAREAESTLFRNGFEG